MTATQKLTPKQAAFVEEHAIDMNATQAAIRAGYSAKTAGDGSALNCSPKLTSPKQSPKRGSIARSEQK